MDNPIIRSIKDKGMKFSERMNNQNGLFRSDRLKFLFIFIGIIAAVIAAYLVWNYFFNSEAIERRQNKEKYNQFFQALSDGEERQKADTYGGKTPQETINLFVSALEKDDLELASKYFTLTVEGKTDPKWLAVLEEGRAEGKIPAVIEALKIAKEDKEASVNPENHAVFKTKDNLGELVLYISLSLSKYSNLWKIAGI